MGEYAIAEQKKLIAWILNRCQEQNVHSDRAEVIKQSF
jgi:hypothetical protein